MTDILSMMRKDPVASAAALVALVGLATIVGFLFFEHVLGYEPCALCLDQRKAFYVAVPLAALLCLGAGHGASRKVLFLGFVVIAAAMLWNTGLAAFHAGVEWKFWPGPSDCSGPVNNFGAAGDMLNRLQTIRIARCDDAAWRLFGISMAGYDVLISAFLTAVAVFGAKAAWARPEENT
jgi:disulfide bond formation protein DsbB